MNSQIKNQIGGVFIPVSRIEAAKDWYCQILDLPKVGEILYGHLFVIPMQGTAGVVLDSKIYSPDHVLKVPIIQFISYDIEQSYEYMRMNQVELMTDIVNNHWFTFRDPDGNIIMVSQ